MVEYQSTGSEFMALLLPDPMGNSRDAQKESLHLSEGCSTLRRLVPVIKHIKLVKYIFNINIYRLIKNQN